MQVIFFFSVSKGSDTKIYFQVNIYQSNHTSFVKRPKIKLELEGTNCSHKKVSKQKGKVCYFLNKHSLYSSRTEMAKKCQSTKNVNIMASLLLHHVFLFHNLGNKLGL